MKKIALAFSAAALALAGAAYAAPDGPPPPEGGMAMHRPMMADPMGDKVVTKAEFEAHAKAMFDKMDVNHDGRIDKGDREAKMMEKFKSIDTDGNGSISPAEFMAAHAKGGHEGMQHEMGHGMDSNRMEKDRAGPGGGHEMMGMMMLRMADTNHDGAVTRDEFMAAAMKHFDMVDADHDGKLTPEERRAAMQKMREHMRGMMGGKMGMHRMGKMGGQPGDMPPPPPPPAH